MINEKLEKMLEAVEQIIINTKPTIALQAVEQLIAVPDAEKRISTMINVIDRTSPEVKGKITTYLDDYLTFVEQVGEKYGEIEKELSPELVFRLRYFKCSQSNDIGKIKELLDKYKDINCPEYANALLLYGLNTKDIVMISRAIDKIEDPEQALAISEKLKQAELGNEIPYAMAKLLMKSDKNATIRESISYLKLALQDQTKLKDLTKAIEDNVEKLMRTDEGLELLNNLDLPFYALLSNRMSFIKKVASKQPDLSVILIDKVSTLENNFKSLCDLADIIADTNLEALPKALELYELALSKDKNYDNTIIIGKRALKFGNLEKATAYFTEALSLEAQPIEVQSVANFLFENKLYDLASKFYLRELENSKDIKRCISLALNFNTPDAIEIRKLLLKKALENTDLVEEYLRLNAYAGGRKQFSVNKFTEAFVLALEKFKSKDDFDKAINFMDKEYGAKSTVGAISAVKTALQNVFPECLELMESYVKNWEESQKAKIQLIKKDESKSEESSPANPEADKKKEKLDRIVDTFLDDPRPDLYYKRNPKYVEEKHGDILEELEEAEDQGLLKPKRDIEDEIINDVKEYKANKEKDKLILRKERKKKPDTDEEKANDNFKDLLDELDTEENENLKREKEEKKEVPDENKSNDDDDINGVPVN